MFREALLNRLIFVGVTFFVLVVGAQFCRWYIRQEITEELARRAAAMQRLENRKAQHTAEAVDPLTEIAVFETLQMPLSNDDTQRMPEETEALP